MNVSSIMRLVCLINLYSFATSAIKDELNVFLKSPETQRFFNLNAQETRYEIERENVRKLRDLKGEVSATIADPEIAQEILKDIDAIIHAMPQLGIEEGLIDEQALKLEQLQKDASRISGVNLGDFKKIVRIINKIKRYYQQSVESLIHGGTLHLPQEKFSKLYTFVSEICRANNMKIPQIYVAPANDPLDFTAYASSVRYQKFKSSQFIVISENYAKGRDEIIKSVIAHELGHLYYGDLDRCYKFSNAAIKVKMNRMKEYRADLFAAQYGLGPASARELAATRQPWIPSDWASSSHPSTEDRMNIAKNLPEAPVFLKHEKSLWGIFPFFKKKEFFRTEYSPVFSEGRMRLEPVTKPAFPLAPKIVSSSAQPIRPQLRTVQAALQAAKRLPK